MIEVFWAFVLMGVLIPYFGKLEERRREEKCRQWYESLSEEELAEFNRKRQKQISEYYQKTTEELHSRLGDEEFEI